MASRPVSTLKFVGSISLGLLTGLSYTLSTLTLPTFLALPSATTAARAFTNLTTISQTHIRSLAAISSTSFLLAYLLSPRYQKHPYLLWTTLFVAPLGFADYLLPESLAQLSTSSTHGRVAKKDRKGKGRQMDSSFEVVGGDSEGTVSEGAASEEEEEINGEEVRERIEVFRLGQTVRSVVAGIAFVMSILGIWGDGAVDVVVLEV